MKAKKSSAAVRVSDVVRVMQTLAPLSLAEEWDNVGLLAGSPDQPVQRVLLTIDLLPAVVREASEQACQVVISYHPPIFKAVRRLPAAEPLAQAIRAGLAVYAPHTALDAIPHGTNGVLAELCGLRDTEPLRPKGLPDQTCKLITFVPGEAVAKVSQALFAAGAGHIGNYHSCSFRSPGTGTFWGNDDASPVVGQKGRLEEVPELRLEVLVENTKLGAVVQALRGAHPYEEPAFDLVRLAAPPSAAGMGRIGRLAEPTLLGTLLQELTIALRQPALALVGQPGDKVRRVAVLAGAGGEFVDDAIRAKADLLVTGELRHHEALRAEQRGLRVICLGHGNSERPTLAWLRQELTQALPTIEVLLSGQDRDPLRPAVGF